MKRLAVYDFDATLINSPEKEEGMHQWEKVKGEKYPHIGWWGRPESLDTEVFDIKPNPEILNKLNSDLNAVDTHVIILTSRQEKLRPQLEKVLKKNNISVDELVMRKGAPDKGDIIMKYVNDNSDLEYIVAYDDFAGGNQDKINEYTKIADELKQKGVEYNIIRVVDGKQANMVESTNILMHMIHEEILKFKQESEN